jgi:hypothetical protein
LSTAGDREYLRVAGRLLIVYFWFLPSYTLLILSVIVGNLINLFDVLSSFKMPVCLSVRFENFVFFYLFIVTASVTCFSKCVSLSSRDREAGGGFHPLSLT